MSPPVRTPDGWSSNISLATDADGAFGRQCPDCRNYYKLFLDDYQLARDRRRLTCPACGHTGSDESFITTDQRRRLKAGTDQFLRAAAHAAMSEFLREMGGRTVRLGPNASLTYNTRPSPPPITTPLPSYVERETLRTFTCPNGGHRAVIYDLLAFCPYCGPDTPPRAVFDDNIAAMSRRLDDADAMPAEKVAAGEQTTAIEQSLGRVVSALQTLAKRLHARADKDEPKGNPWQNIDRLTELWVASFEADPLEGLPKETVQALRLGFARRHVLEHNGGVVDERYRRETGEGTVGRRVRFGSALVRQVTAAANQLADCLEATSTVAEAPTGAEEQQRVAGQI